MKRNFVLWLFVVLALITQGCTSPARNDVIPEPSPSPEGPTYTTYYTVVNGGYEITWYAENPDGETRGYKNFCPDDWYQVDFVGGGLFNPDKIYCKPYKKIVLEENRLLGPQGTEELIQSMGEPRYEGYWVEFEMHEKDGTVHNEKWKLWSTGARQKYSTAEYQRCYDIAQALFSNDIGDFWPTECPTEMIAPE